MRVHERAPGDAARLEELIGSETDADQRDRYRIALLALRGREKLEIAGLLGVCKRTVEDWAYRYRDGGIDALKARPRGGSAPRLRGAAAARLAARLDAGATAADKVCTLRGKDVQRIVREELDTPLALASVYRTLHRLGYSCLAPRPRHEKQDLEAQKKFKEVAAPLLSAP
jgi:transposase